MPVDNGPIAGGEDGQKSPFPPANRDRLDKVTTSADFCLCVPENCTIRLEQKHGEYVERCMPNLDLNTISVYQLGGTAKVVRQSVKPSRGVNTHAVHDWNVRSGWLDDSTRDKCKVESLRTSLSRTKRTLYELAACNPWAYYVTLTLSPEKWDRFNPEGLQKAFSDESKRWRNGKVHGKKLYASYRYLLVPEPHKNGAVHVHGFVSLIPPKYLVQYTMDDVNSATPLPKYVR